MPDVQPQPRPPQPLEQGNPLAGGFLIGLMLPLAGWLGRFGLEVGIRPGAVLFLWSVVGLVLLVCVIATSAVRGRLAKELFVAGLFLGLGALLGVLYLTFGAVLYPLAEWGQAG